MSAVLVEFPERSVGDIPRMLRCLAESLERGEYGDAHNLGWVIDCGSGRIEIGLLGSSAIAGAEAHLLFACAMRKLEAAAMDGS